MPSFSRKVDIPGKTAQELFEKVSSDIDRFMSKTPVGKYDIDRDAGRKEVRVKSSMFSATLVCGESYLDVNVSLSLLASPFRSKIDEGINKWLAKTFNVQSG